MSYIHPSDVVSPRASVSNLHPIVNKGENSWSAALLSWDHSTSIGLRWNGGTQEGSNRPHPGNPQSRGLPTWFIVPREIAPDVLQSLVQHGLGGEGIDDDEARKWAEKGGQEIGHSLLHKDNFDERVAQVIKAMKKAGEI